MAKTVLELSQEAQFKSDELHGIFEKHKTDKIDERGQPLFDMPDDVLTDVKARTEHLNDVNRELEAARAQEAYIQNQQRIQDLKEIKRDVPHAAPRVDPRTSEMRGYGSDQKQLGDMVADSREYKFRSTGSKKFSIDLPEVDVKTLLSLTAGFSAPNNRGPKVVLSAQRRPMVADLIPSDTTTANVIKFMEETTFTNAAASTAEGGLKQESALAFTERTNIVEKIATWIPVTEEQIDDVPQLRALLDNRLTLMLMLTEETQLLSGNASSPQLDGFLHKSGVQTQAKGTDDSQDAIYKAFTLVRWTGFAEPSGVIMHPNDWQDIRLLRTTDGLYIFGNPSEPGEERLWGKPVVVTSAMTENTALTGDFVMYSHISRRMGIRIDVSDSHDTYFIYNKLAVRAEERLSLEIYRAAAFAKVTSV